jgi:hypothetical protein
MRTLIKLYKAWRERRRIKRILDRSRATRPRRRS